MIDLPPYAHRITFGDCDPAGIVFYPNIFRWMDAAFHAALHPLGGHAVICRELGAIGLGLLDATCAFQAPMRDGDQVTLHPRIADWGRKSLTVDYKGLVGGRACFAGREVRGIFVETPQGLVAEPISRLRAIFRDRNRTD